MGVCVWPLLIIILRLLSWFCACVPVDSARVGSSLVLPHVPGGGVQVRALGTIDGTPSVCYPQRTENRVLFFGLWVLSCVELLFSGRSRTSIMDRR